MSCEFIGLCGLLTPEWVSAVAELIGVLFLGFGVIVGERIRQRVQARSDHEKRESEEHHIMEAMFRMRTTAEVFMSTAGEIRRDLHENSMPLGRYGDRLQVAINRIEDLRFSREERAAFGPKRSLDLLALFDTAVRTRELLERVLKLVRERPYRQEPTEEDREHLSGISDILDKLTNAVLEVFHRLSERR